MLKFLRRYNKAILMVGGSILMVLFLLPSTTNQIGQNMMNKAVAYADGRKVTVLDMQEAVREIEVLERLNPGLLQGLGVGRRPEHWYLLVHEARQAGLIGGPKEARKDLPQDMLDMMRASASESQMDRLLANVRGVLRLVSSSSAGSLYSSREAVLLGQKMFDTASVNIVVVPAGKIGESLPVPDEARLVEHFEKYKDTDPLSDPMGIGYRRADAVQVEWLSIDRASIEAAFVPDPIEVNKYWRQNQAKFTGEFTAVKAQVEQEYERTQVDLALSRVADVLKRELFRSTSALPADGAYKALPADWSQKMPKLADLSALADAEMRKQFPSLTQGPTVTANDGVWRTGSDLSRLPAVGFSFLQQGNGGRLMFSQLALTMRELVGPSLFAVQENMVIGPLQDFRGSLFYFRVVASRKAGPPASLDEVREVVSRDVRTLDGFERLKSEKEQYRERAVADGLTKLAESAAVTVRQGVEVTGQMVRPIAGSQTPDQSLDEPEFREAIMALARRLDPKVDATTIDASLRTSVAASPRARGLIVGQIVRYRPMTVEQFRSNAEAIARFAAGELGGEGIISAFSYERLRERHDFKIVGGDEESESEADVRQAEAAPAGG
jgi:hypothetical protein